MQYSYDVSVSEDDYIEFNTYHFYMQKSNVILNWVLRLLPSIIFIGAILFQYLKGERQLAFLIIEAVLFFVFALIWFLCSKNVFVRSFEKQIRKLKSLGKLPFSEMATIDFSDDSITETTRTCTNTVTYNDVERLCVNSNGRAIYIFFNAVAAFLIPFGTFSTDAERLEFISFVENKIGKPAEYGKSK